MRRTDFHQTHRVYVAGAILEDMKTLSFHLLYGPSCQIFLSSVVHYMRWHLAAVDGKPMTADVADADAKSDIPYFKPRYQFKHASPRTCGYKSILVSLVGKTCNVYFIVNPCKCLHHDTFLFMLWKMATKLLSTYARWIAVSLIQPQRTGSGCLSELYFV